MLIGLSGKKQVGKDTSCDLIKRLTILPYAHNQFERHAFADKLKQCAALILGCKVEQFEDNEFKDTPTWIPYKGGYMTARQLLQVLGTEVGRNIYPNLWVESLLNDYRYHPQYPYTNCDNPLILPNWVISDVRFPTEVKAIEERGGIVIRINRDTEYSDNHQSEIALDNYPFQYSIDNNGTVEELKENLVYILSKERILQ